MGEQNVFPARFSDAGFSCGSWADVTPPASPGTEGGIGDRSRKAPNSRRTPETPAAGRMTTSTLQVRVDRRRHGPERGRSLEGQAFGSDVEVVRRQRVDVEIFDAPVPESEDEAHGLAANEHVGDAFGGDRARGLRV